MPSRYNCLVIHLVIAALCCKEPIIHTTYLKNWEVFAVTKTTMIIMVLMNKNYNFHVKYNINTHTHDFLSVLFIALYIFK